MCWTYSRAGVGPATSAGAGSAGWRCRSAAIPARARTSIWSARILATSRLSLKAQSFTESVIREMTRLNLALNGPERAINFAQGFPDFQTDPRILEAAAAALRDGYNQYATPWGPPQLRPAVPRTQPAPPRPPLPPATKLTASCWAD